MKLDEEIFNMLKSEEIERFCNSILRRAFRKSMVEELEILYDCQLGKNYTEILKQWVTKAR